MEKKLSEKLPLKSFIKGQRIGMGDGIQPLGTEIARDAVKESPKLGFDNGMINKAMNIANKLQRIKQMVTDKEDKAMVGEFQDELISPSISPRNNMGSFNTYDNTKVTLYYSPDGTMIDTNGVSYSIDMNGNVYPSTITPQKPSFKSEISSVTTPADRIETYSDPKFIGTKYDKEEKAIGTIPTPVKYVIANTPPNKLAAADPRWGTKTAWQSKDFMARQQKLETYSSEVAMLIEAVRNVVKTATGRTYEDNELDFIANFGSPIEGNKHKISILLSKPISLGLILTRELVDGKLKWSADVGVLDDTPITIVDKLTTLRGSEITVDDSTVDKTNKRRRIKL